MNILILGAGTRNMIIRYFRETLAGTGKVIAADCSPLAPALYEADDYALVPPYTAPDYLTEVLALCKKERIRGVLSLIDPEVRLLAGHRASFANAGIVVIGSGFESCILADNKLLLSEWLNAHNFPGVKTWPNQETFMSAVEKGQATFPVTVKPMYGSASIGVSVAEDMKALALRFQRENGLIIQEHLKGVEIGADAYVDLISGGVVSVFTKQKLRMRAGETDKSVSFRDPELYALLSDFLKEAGFCGPVDMDLFRTENGEYRILEVNARFGGGYPHAHALGCNHVQMIVNNLAGKVNPRRIGDYETGVAMMKHSEISLLYGQNQEF